MVGKESGSVKTEHSATGTGRLRARGHWLGEVIRAGRWGAVCSTPPFENGDMEYYGSYY